MIRSEKDPVQNAINENISKTLSNKLEQLPKRSLFSFVGTKQLTEDVSLN